METRINDSGMTFVIPLQVYERQASELYVYTTAYTEDQKEYVKEKLVEMLKRSGFSIET